MNPTLLNYIRTLSASDKKSLSQKALKTAEEIGELAKVILPYDGAATTQHRFVAKERILEEVADSILCLLSIAYDLNFSDEDIASTMLTKATYWQELQSRESEIKYPLPYEIHITVSAEDKGINLDYFKETCKNTGVKPLLIDMHDRMGGTVMLDAQTSSVFMGDNTGAINEARRISDALSRSGFTPVREKIETVPWHPAAPSLKHNNPVMPQDCYFEAHFNIVIDDTRKDKLTDLLRPTEAHLSRNAFKKINEEEYVIMATLRHYTGTFEDFEKASKELVELLTSNGFDVPKTITEFSIYDTKVTHDSVWLNP